MDTLGFILHLSWVTLEYEEDKVNISQTPSIYLPGDVHVFFFNYKVKTGRRIPKRKKYKIRLPKGYL